MKIKLSSILIGVTNIKDSKWFYEKVLGMSFEEFRPPFASARLGSIEFNIEENTDYRDSNWAQNHIGGRKQFSFEVENLDDFLDYARSLGVEIVQNKQIQSWGWAEAVICDPDKNEFLIEQQIQ